MIADAFTRVGYPILPEVALRSTPARRGRGGSAGWRPQRSAVRWPTSAATAPPLVTPRDFDLSPYFEVVKFNHLGDPRLNYREIVWDDSPTAPLAHDREMARSARRQ